MNVVDVGVEQKKNCHSCRVQMNSLAIAIKQGGILVILESVGNVGGCK
jgi:hypothetical protein